jgi:hypothetical protein
MFVLFLITSTQHGAHHFLVLLHGFVAQLFGGLGL